MELKILYMIQGWHQDWLSDIMVFFSTISNGGGVWIAACMVLLLFPKTRKCAVTMAVAMLLTMLLGNEVIKKSVARFRPCTIDTSVTLLIPRPGQYSFPSGHTANSFTAAVSIFLYYRKPGILALAAASVIAFSRMYLFVHYPTDILGGILLGALDAMLIYGVIWKWEHKKSKGKSITRGENG